MFFVCARVSSSLLISTRGRESNLSEEKFPEKGGWGHFRKILKKRNKTNFFSYRLFKTSAANALAFAINASDAASAPALSSISHATSTRVRQASARDGVPLVKFPKALADASVMTASILDSTSCSLNVRKSMAPRKRSASSNCFSYEYAGDAYNGETVDSFMEELKGASLFSVMSKLSRTCSGVKWFFFYSLFAAGGAGVDTLNHQSSLFTLFSPSLASGIKDPCWYCCCRDDATRVSS